MAIKHELIVVGKLKDKHLIQLEADYFKRIPKGQLSITELKANALNKEAEGDTILKKVSPSDQLIVLTEWGEEYASINFSQFIFSEKMMNQKAIFVICGAEGPSQKLLERANKQLSLSKLTFPHKLARILFIEQYYRAITIKNNHPYHN